MPCADKKHSSKNVQLELALQLVSRELKQLASVSNRLQGSIGEVLRDSDIGPSEAAYDLQNLDRLTQTIEALVDFTNQLSLQMQPDWSVDTERAARMLTLAAVATRLSASDDELPRDDQNGDSSGECVYL